MSRCVFETRDCLMARGAGCERRWSAPPPSRAPTGCARRTAAGTAGTGSRSYGRSRRTLQPLRLRVPVHDITMTWRSVAEVRKRCRGAPGSPNLKHVGIRLSVIPVQAGECARPIDYNKSKVLHVMFIK